MNSLTTDELITTLEQLFEKRSRKVKTKKPEVFSIYNTATGGSEEVIHLSDYESLQAECEKLRKDAERYQWLRGYFCSAREDLDDCLVEACEDNDAFKLDAAIDEAMQEPNHDSQ